MHHQRPALCVSLLLAACMGDIDGGTGHGVDSDPANPLPTGSGFPTDPTQPPLTDAPRPNVPGCTGGIDPGPAVARRLTRFEYDNTIRDLLGLNLGLAGKAFPPEEHPFGFDNTAAALSVSPLLAEDYLIAAETIATQALANLPKILPCDPARDGTAACGRKFIQTFGARAWRRPLAAEDVERMGKLLDWGVTNGDFNHGVQLAIEALLQSPQFLYRLELSSTPVASGVVRVDSWEMASRLSFLLWGSLPDDMLFMAATADQLVTSAQVSAQARRMLADPRLRQMVAHFNQQWLTLDEMGDLEKDTRIFRTFTSTVKTSMLGQVQRFTDWAIFDGDGTLPTLYTSPTTFLNGTLTTFLGVTAGPTGDTLAKFNLDAKQGVGVLTQPGLMALLAKPDQTNPITRGAFVRERVLCQDIPPPPDNLMVMPPKLDPNLTTRQRFEQHRKDPSCAGCHAMMDPIGFGFENYDAVGKYRTMENGKPIDAAGEVLASDVGGAFNGAAELGGKLVKSPMVAGCMVKQWFRYGYGRPEHVDGECSLATLQDAFMKSSLSIRQLILNLVQTDAFLYRKVGS